MSFKVPQCHAIPCLSIASGTFAARETVQDVAKFLQLFLTHEAAEFHFALPGSGRLDDATATLADAGLVPSSVITCTADAASGVPVQLRPELIAVKQAPASAQPRHLEAFTTN